tara:strand:+ start:183 stop:482 length:300 start_codon:yes stop_codon:yes gene_type:complete
MSRNVELLHNLATNDQYNKLIDCRKVKVFMDILRDSAKTNMWGAPAYLQAHFHGMTRVEAREITMAYMGHGVDEVNYAKVYEDNFETFINHMGKVNETD